MHGMKQARTSPHFYVCLAFVCRIYFCEPSIFNLHTVVRCVATEDPCRRCQSVWYIVEVLFFGSHATHGDCQNNMGFLWTQQNRWPDAYCITECLTSPGWRDMLEWQIMLNGQSA